MEAVRGHDRVRRQDRVRLGEVEPGPRGVLFDVGDGVTGAQGDGRVLLAGGQQRCVQVGAVGDEVGVGEALGVGGTAQVQGRDLVAGQGIHHDQPGRGDRRPPDGRQDAEPLQGEGGVGRELQTGADLAEPDGPFDEGDAVSGAGDRQRRGQPTDAAPDHGDAERIWGDGHTASWRGWERRAPAEGPGK